MYLRGKFGYTDMIKNLVFDFGGVLTAIKTEQAIERFRNLGLQNPEEYLNAYKQTGIFFQLENGDIDAETFCAAKLSKSSDLTQSLNLNESESVSTLSINLYCRLAHSPLPSLCR